MRRIITLVMLMAAAQGWAQYAGYKPVANADAFKQQFAHASQATQTIKCDFVQEKNLSMLSDKIVSTGKFWFKKENKVRMEYEKPSYYLMVINGNTIKTKDGQKENKVSTKSNKMFEQVNKMMIDCVQGTALNNKDFTTILFENGQYYLVEMTPVIKNLKGIFKHIVLTVDKKDHTVTKMEMLELSGDNTVITFQHRQINTAISDEVFSVK